MADEVTPPEAVEPPEAAVQPEPFEPAGAEPPEPSEPPEPAGAEPPVVAAEARKRWTPRRTFAAVGWAVTAAVVIAAVVAAVAIVTGNHGGGRSLRAKAGDCLSGDSDHDLRFVQCDDPAVKWTVVSVVDGQSQRDSRQKSCQRWPEAQASYWESRNAQNGFVLCLRPVTPG
ncbi:hypothetical protein HC031_11070 [Planosporangium thailandense]|uniref:Uncharacterized protein n=1 Tax=Planosporangium thailandense TaxID=765197 RepID=A0ABX0XW22_9ACTN|nr:hypothetical protein [Planosporangium thailandense]NJC70247.1 hypothetical protein [Planosporangium thailandense]